jgi:hypothetical protein
MTALFLKFVVPILITIAWATVASLLSLLLGHKTQVEGWCEANPKAAFVLHVLRATGFDVWKIVGAAKQYAETKQVTQ